jgi:TIR domain
MSKSVFINYRRRGEAQGMAGRLYDKLALGLPPRSVFMDVDAMLPGLDFTKQLGDEVGKCSIVLAMIGEDWAQVRDEAGKRRLDDPNDWVRVELAAALQRDIPVIPVLLDMAKMPRPDELPAELASLTKRQAVELRSTRFTADADAILAHIQKALGVKTSSGYLKIKIAVGAVAALVLGIGLAIGLQLFPANPSDQATAQRQHDAEARLAEQRRRDAETATAAALEKQRQAEQSQREAEAAAAAAIERQRATVAAESAQAPATTSALPTEQSPEAARQTFWSHNGSIVYLVVDGQHRKFYYERPRPGMVQAGASKGSLLFDGEFQGSSYAGTAYVFDNRCGPRTYYVVGPILDEGSRVVMRGSAPRVDHDCQVTSYLNDTLEFKLLPGQ